MAITEENRNVTNGPISTIFDALDEKQRKKLDNATVTRSPSSLTKVHEIFHLAEKGISQQTLYRYARKIRDQANKLALLESTFTSEVDIVEHLKNQIGRQCTDMILNADVNGITPLDTQRIANAFGKCLQYDLVIARTRAIVDSNDRKARCEAEIPARRDRTKALEAATDQSRARKEAVLSQTCGPNNSRATPRPTRQELEVGNDPDAPHGRNEDGTPRTHEQYCATVKKVLFEVYAPKSVKEAAAREAAAREAAEKTAAAKQNPDRSCDPAEIDASGPDPSIGNPGALNCAGSPVRAGSTPRHVPPWRGFSPDPSGESLSPLLRVEGQAADPRFTSFGDVALFETRQSVLIEPSPSMDT